MIQIRVNIEDVHITPSTDLNKECNIFYSLFYFLFNYYLTVIFFTGILAVVTFYLVVVRCASKIVSHHM